jgi:Matrixin
MKNWFPQFLFLLLLIIGGVFYLGKQIPCKQVTTYRLGEIDPRFDLSQSEIKALLLSAEKPWEMLAKRELLAYDQEKGKVVVNFIYDERQERTKELGKLSTEEEKLNTTQAQIDTTYNTLKEQYEKRSTAYEQGLSQYKTRLDAYNREVSQLNRSGGASESELKRLTKESKDLEKKNIELESERLALNTLANKLNALAKNSEQVVEKFNEKVENFEERFSGGGLFDQGEFGGAELNIYQFQTKEDLALVLSHEFGHSLGLDHVENPNSLMYYLMEKQPKEIALTAEDIASFESLCSEPNNFTLTNLKQIGHFLQLRLAFVEKKIYE